LTSEREIHPLLQIGYGWYGRKGPSICIVASCSNPWKSRQLINIIDLLLWLSLSSWLSWEGIRSR
jgi:hypothetical protein